jgi:hypothetical protein
MLPFSERIDVGVDRDEQKRIACQNIGITLIEVPYWCNLSMSQLVSTITKYRPDFKPHHYASKHLASNTSFTRQEVDIEI